MEDEILAGCILTNISIPGNIIFVDTFRELINRKKISAISFLINIIAENKRVYLTFICWKDNNIEIIVSINDFTQLTPAIFVEMQFCKELVVELQSKCRSPNFSYGAF